MKAYGRESGISAIVRSKLTTILLIGLLVMSATLASVGAGDKPRETTNVIPKGNQAIDGEPMKIQTEIISLDFSKPTLQETGAHMKVTVKEAESFVLNPTAPMLPMKTITLKLPFKTKIISVELAQELLTEELRIDKLVTPFPKPRPLCYCTCAGATEEIELDDKIYGSSELYPAKWFDYKLTAGIDPSTDERKNFLTISFYPVRYSPKTSVIQYATIAELIIKYAEPLGPPLGNPSYDMIIIAPSSFYTQLSNLTIHKDNHGIITKLVNLTDVYSGTYFPVQGSDNPERIKYFIKNATDDWGITYVLLGGDSDQFPVRTIYMPDTLPDDGDYGPTDLYYADLFNGSGAFSSWNFDGDGRWGERLDDNVDIRPDVYIGRLPASTSTEMDLLVSKIITYETTAYGQSWFNNVTFVGSDTFDTSPGGIPEGEMEKEFLTTNYMSPMGFNVTNLYETDFYPANDGDATRQNVTNTIDAGTGFVNFANHGDYNGVIYCSLGTPVIRNVDAFGLTNGDKLPFVYADACLTNGFDNSSIDSLSEKFMLAPNGGAIGYIGSTRVGWGINDNAHILATSGYLDVRTWRAYYFGQETPAKMLAQAQNDFVDNQNPLSDNLSYKTVVQNMLLGDPSLKLGGYPGLAITYPSNGDFVAGTINITGIASGAIPTDYVEVKIDSGAWDLATGNTTWYYIWDTTSVLDGLHTIYARGWNGTSFSNATPVNVNVDNTKPTSSVSAQPAYQTTLTFPINYARDDGAGSGVRNITLYYRFNLAGGWIQYGIDMPADGIMVFTAGSDGFYEFYSRAYDNVGNFEDAPLGNDTWTIVDAQKPSSSVDALPAYTTTSIFNVDATALPDANGIQMVELWYNNGTSWIKYLPDDTTPPYSWSFDSTTTGDGVYQFYSRAYDIPGNYEDAPVGNDTWTVVDTQKPISSVAPLPMYTTTSSFTIDAIASDITSGVKNVTLWYGKDGAIPILCSTDNAPPWSFNFDTLATGNGVYEFFSRAYDNVGHYENAPAGNDTWTIVDTQKPSSSVDALATYINSTAFSVDATVLPDANGIQMVELWYNKDGAGDVSYGTDFSAPWSFNFNTLTIGGDGTYEFYSIAYDGAGNVENIPLAPDTSTMVDTKKPSSSVDSLPLYTTIPSFVLSVNASDVMSGVQQVELWYSKDGGLYQLYATDTASPWSFDFNTSTTGGDGTYGFYSQAYDNANNYEIAPVANDTWTIVDTQRPSSSVDSLPAYTTTAMFTITVTATDLASGVQQVELWYNRDSTGYVLYATGIFPPWSFNFDTATTGGDGTYEFYSMANDSAGFAENLPAGPDASTIVDTQKPTSSVNSQDEYTTAESFIIIVTASDLESGLEKVELWYNKDYAGYVLYGNDTVSPWAFNFNTSTTGGEGFYEFYSLAYDRASNIEDTPIPLVADESIIVDMTPPQIQITSPSEGEWLTSSAIAVDWFGSDSLSGIEYYETKIDLGSWVPKGTGLQHTFTGLFEGTHSISVRAYDAAMNQNTTSLSINIDLLPPVLAIISPTNNSKVNSSTVVVTWSGSDSSSGINHYEIKLDYGFYVPVGLNQTHTFYNLTNGTHKFTVKAVDNTSRVTESSTTIDVELEVEVEDKGDIFAAIRDIFVDYWWAWLILIVSIVIIIVAFVATRRRKKKGKEAEVPKAKPPSQPKTSKPSASQPPKPQAPKKSQTPKSPQTKQPQKPQSPPPQSSQPSKPSPQPPKT